MLKSIRQSPLKLAIIIVVLVVLNVIGWTAYNNWEKPLGEPLNLPTLSPSLSPEPDQTDVPPDNGTEESSPTETPVDYVTPTLEPVCGNDTSMTILVTGIDSTGYLYGLADSIRIVRLDFQTKKITVLALPRDLWVEIPGAASGGVNVGKLNQAYFYGTEGMNFYAGSGYGSGLMAHTLLHNYGLHIDHYLSVNMHAFQEIIDALGGVYVYFPENVYIKYFNTPKLYLEAGTHHVDGKQAEQVVRARIIGEDIARINNQNLILKALVVKMLTLDGIKLLPELANRLKAFVLTDFSPADITQMICLASQINTQDDIVYHSVLTNAEVVESGLWINDAFLGHSVFALNVDKDLITQRLAGFQAGIWP
jgi:LCP family protein required for cell wall assembly